MINNLINFFGANSKLHLLKIFIIFGLAGSLSVVLSEPLLQLVSIEKFISNKFFYWLIRLILIFLINDLILQVELEQGLYCKKHVLRQK